MSDDVKRGIRYGIALAGFASALVHQSLGWFLVWSAWAIAEFYIAPRRSPVVILRDCPVSQTGNDITVIGVAEIRLENCRIAGRRADPAGGTP